MIRKAFILLLILIIGVFSFILIKCDANDIAYVTKKKYQFVTVLSISPAISAVNVPKNAYISVTFSEAMDPSTFGGAVSLQSNLGVLSIANYTQSWSNSNMTLTLIPIGIPLASDTIYSLTINTSIRSADGNPMNANYSTAFTTGNIADTIAPNINSRCVNSGAGCVATTGTINPVSGVTLSFSESMLPNSVEAGLSLTVDTGAEVRTITPTSVSWSNFNKDAVFTYSTVPSGTATLTLTNNAVDASGNALSNPFTDTFTVGSSNIVDYQVTASSFPLGGTINAAVAGNFTITNIGSVNGTSNLSWTVYASADAVYNTGDTPISSGTQPALNAGSSINVPFSGIWGSAPGSYYLIVVLSGGGDGNVVNNNKSSSVIQVIAPAPDYVVSSSNFPASGITSTAVNGSFVITNIGTVNGANSLTWNVYISSDAVLGGDTQIATGIQTQLNAGVSSVSIPFSGTWSATAGTYYLIITLTTTDDGNTTNNTKISTAIPVNLPTQPDYTISSPTFPASGTPNGSLNGSFTITNSGGANGAQIISWSVYLSTDTVLNTGTDTQIATAFYPALNAGQTSTTINYAGNWPATSGNYYLIISINATDEGNTTNNNSVSNVISVVSLNQDYSLSGLTISSGASPYAEGSALTGSFTATNNGTLAGIALTWQIWACDTATCAGATKIQVSGAGATGATGSLAIGGNQLISFSGNWPTGSNGNPRYLVALLSASGETNTANDKTASAVLTINGLASTPTFSIPGNTYTSAQTVTMMVANPAGSTVIYTTNNTAPTADASCNATNGTAVASASTVNINTTTTLRAIGCKATWANSTENTATYTITGTVDTPTFSIPGNTYTSAQTVTMNVVNPTLATVIYTTNNTAPTANATCTATNGTAITSGNSVNINGTTVLRAIGCKAGWTSSAETSATYTLQPITPTQTAGSAPGTYTTAQNITISTTTTNATIWYTTNGTAPTCGTGTSGTANTSTVNVSLTQGYHIVKAVACVTGWTDSTVASIGTYDLRWTQETASAGWVARRQHTSVIHNGKIFVIGGYGGGVYKNDVWSSTDGITWTLVTASAGWVARGYHSSVVFNGKIFVMGGWDGTATRSDVWSSVDGVTWTQETASAGWGLRYFHSSVVLGTKIFVIGGQTNGSVNKNDVWSSLDGITWTQETVSAPWTARYSHASVVLGTKIYLMGGWDGTSKNDVWSSLDGITWTQETVSAGWIGRQTHTSVVFNGKIFVMGGLDGASNRRNDVWSTLDGITWTQETVSAGWVGRSYHASVVFNGKIFVMGGLDGTAADRNDVWSGLY